MWSFWSWLVVAVVVKAVVVLAVYLQGFLA
jgi:hypothetical protein